MRLYHPDSPGERVIVVRGFWGRLFKPKHFATLSEAIEDSKRAEQVRLAQKNYPS